MSHRLNWNSYRLTHGPQQGVQAFYWGLGWKEEDFHKPQIGIGVPLLDANLCNIHAHTLAEWVKTGCAEAGLHGFGFGVPSVSDNITQGHEGGWASLPSRNMIANSAEAVCSGHAFDGMIGLHHCDKNGPGFALALARMNLPGFLLSGGTIRPGCALGRSLTIQDVYDSQAGHEVGAISPEELKIVLQNACPGAGGCGIAASFNTWAMAMEAMGLMLPGSSSTPAEGQTLRAMALSAGRTMHSVLEKGLRPRDILTETAFRNATAMIGAVGGSTNGVLHLLALAEEAGIPFGLKQMQQVFRTTPVFCQFAPRGKGTMIDLHGLGGTPALVKHLIRAEVLDGNALTIWGETLAESVREAPDLGENQDLVAPLKRPFKEYADIQVCFGNLAPDGIVFKVSNRQDPFFEGEAICFDDVESIVTAVRTKRIRPGHAVILRGLGPVACGMPEVLLATSVLSVKELDGRIAFLSDARISGVSHGAIGVHCAPEAAVGGPIGLVQDGDRIHFDLLAGTLEWKGADSSMAWSGPRQRLPVYLSDFAATALQANRGCVSRSVVE